MLRLRLPESGREFPIDIVKFNREEHYNHFILESSSNADINITVPFLFDLFDSFNPDEFSVYPLISPTLYREDNIFEVRVSDKKVNRIGWIFPVQSMISKEHSKSENEHFLKYVFVAFHKLLNGSYFESDHYFESSEVNATLSITQIYNSDLIILCLSKQKINQISGFEIFDYLHSLYSYQYFYNNSSGEPPTNIRETASYDQFANIKISPLSKVLREEVFIKSLFKDHLPQVGHPLVHFHLLYQIIELLINRIYDCEIDKLLALAKEKTKQPHDLLEDSNKLQTEIFRIKKLIDNYLHNGHSPASELIRLCNEILKHFNKEKTHVGEAFYHFRNSVVHNFRIVASLDKGLNLFRQINSEFEKFIISIITNYHEPEKVKKLDDAPLAWLSYLLLNEQ